MRWAFTAIYTILIFSTLGIVRTLTSAVRATGNLGALTFGLMGLFLFFLFFFKITNASKSQLILRLILTSCFVSFAAVVTNLPEERMHIIEYGLLGWLIGWSISGSRITFCWIWFGILLGWTIGFCDEIIQYFLPNRVYDIRDVILNGVSANLGVLFFFTSRLKSVSEEKNSMNDE